MCQPGKPRPHGESHSCWRCTPGGVSFHEREVGRVALGLDVLDAAGGGQLVEVEVGELGVARERRHVEVDAVVDHVGVALLLEGRGPSRSARRCAPPPGARGRARGSRAGGGRSPTARCRTAAISAAVLPVAAAASSILSSLSSRVGDEVADVGDVGDVGDVVARGQQHPAQQVGEQLAAHVAEVLRARRRWARTSRSPTAGGCSGSKRCTWRVRVS